MPYANTAEKITEQRVVIRRVVARRNRLRHLIPYLQIIGFLTAAYFADAIIEFFL